MTNRMVTMFATRMRPCRRMPVDTRPLSCRSLLARAALLLRK